MIEKHRQDAQERKKRLQEGKFNCSILIDLFNFFLFLNIYQRLKKQI